MNILKVINPQGMIGQLVLIALIIVSSFLFGMYKGTKECPAVSTTEIHIDPKIKSKKGSTAVMNLGLNNESQDCEQWFIERLGTLSMREIRELKK